MTPEERAKEIVSDAGGICLVGPGVTSHEHTFCDCTVEKMIATALLRARNEALEEAAKGIERFAEGLRVPSVLETVNRRAKEDAEFLDAIAERVRALSGKEPTP